MPSSVISADVAVNSYPDHGPVHDFNFGFIVDSRSRSEFNIGPDTYLGCPLDIMLYKRHLYLIRPCTTFGAAFPPMRSTPLTNAGGPKSPGAVLCPYANGGRAAFY
ncbi:hypothetical protein EVAR_54323_1 [Eumeta japonica]|uniref:Uncharacterized protein n=1 Tax=Eumeta variegata TaxID=151549 RepID=A0A4C1Y5N2_EUMVA|nr:hypothetical protein EVAR_54323_1 [Eumeta japonica]